MSGSISAGMPEKKSSMAARPPAEAPMPTMGNLASFRLVFFTEGVVENVSGDVFWEVMVGAFVRINPFDF